MEPVEITAANNLKVEYVQLMQEMPIKQKELTDSIVSARDELKRIKEEGRIITTDVEKKLLDLKEKEFNFRERESESKESKKALDLEHTRISKELKQAIKDLSRTNQQVLSANEELLRIRISISNANEELKHLLILVEKVEQTKLELVDLREKKGVILGEISTSKEELDVKISSTAATLAKMKLDMIEIQKKSSEAYSLWENYNRELHTNMNDYKILRSRIESKWSRTFPELEIPLS